MSVQREIQLNWWNLSLSENERNAIISAFDAKKISYNSVGAELEKKICEVLNCRYALVTTSGSVALVLALKAIGLKAGDEVLVPNRTFQATANAVHLLGGVAILVDVDPQTGLMSLAEVKRHASSKTKAVIPVHLNGRGVDVETLKTWASERKIAVVEDAAQALLSKRNNQYLGTIGDVGCFSFGVTKFITAGQGGAIVTNSEKIYLEAKKYIFHAMVGTENKKFIEFGFNFRQSDLLSAMALSQFKNLDLKLNKFKRVYSKYFEKLQAFSFLNLQPCDVGQNEVSIWIEILTPYRDQLYKFLADNGVETMKFYPSLHRSDYFRQVSLQFPHSEKFESQGLILPSGPDLTDAEIEKVIQLLAQFEKLNVK